MKNAKIIIWNTYLSRSLIRLIDFPYGQSQQLELAIQYSDKLSFSGVQPKPMFQS
jgi:hypothetical protein